MDKENKDRTPDERLRACLEKTKTPLEELLTDVRDIVQRLEPSSFRFQAWNYPLKHQNAVTLFAGLPLDNNSTERALKKAFQHRKNILFFQIQNGAQAGDPLMSNMETAQLNSLSPARNLKTWPENWRIHHSDRESWLPRATRFQV